MHLLVMIVDVDSLNRATQLPAGEAGGLLPGDGQQPEPPDAAGEERLG